MRKAFPDRRAVVLTRSGYSGCQRHAYRHALKEAARVGIKVDVNMAPGWNMGGPWMTPEKSCRWYLQSEVRLKGPQKFRGKLPLPDGMSYRLLVLPDTTRMPQEVAEKLEELVKAGRNFAPLATVRKVEGPWTVRFDKEWFYPTGGLKGREAEGEFVFKTLEDWSQRPEPAVKYFSGTATYGTEFQLGQDVTGGTRYWLDVGQVHVTAAVRLNGVDLGVVWCAPWRVDVTEALKKGLNKLEIEVVNLWSNRLIGDGKLPESLRRTRTSVSHYYRPPRQGEHPLSPSGLLGPVVLRRETLAGCTPPKAAEESARTTVFTPPAQEVLLKTLRPTHPRLLLTEDDLPRLRKAVRDHPLLSRWYAALKESATETLAERPVDHALPDGRRLLSVSRTVKERVRNLAFVYLIEGDRRYAARAWRELEHAAEFPDWNPSHFLDTAEMTHAFAIGYDWLYHYLDDDRRETVRSALVRLGLEEGREAYRSRFENEPPRRIGDFWVTGVNNWNQVCNGGMGTGALAVAEETPELAADVLGYVMRSLPRAMRYYAPDGAGTEGVTYWDYGTRYNILLLASLQSALGTDFGLSDIDGFRQSGDYQIHISGADRLAFDFGDCTPRAVSAPQHFWMGRRFKQPRLSWFRATTLENSKSDGDALDILWYDESGGDFDPATLPPGKHFRKAEVASFRSSWEDREAIVLAMQGGRNENGAHRHLDLGSFILEAGGERWIAELGKDRETYMRHRHRNQRWEYYRVRAEGHNTLAINPGEGPDQPIGARAVFTSFDADPKHGVAVLDMSEACGKLVSKAERTFELIDRRRVVITDTLLAVEPVEVYWFAHTGAEALVGEDGKTAVLTRNGKQLQVRILESSAPARFAIMPAEPLAGSPNPSPQADNRGYRKLAIHWEDVLNLKFAVEFISPDRPSAIGDRMDCDRTIADPEDGAERAGLGDANAFDSDRASGGRDVGAPRVIRGPGQGTTSVARVDEGRTKTSMKGWELYVWQQDGATRYSLMVGTNRIKADEEIAGSAVQGIEAIKGKLHELKEGESVFLHDRRFGAKAPGAAAKAVGEYCRQIGLKVP